MLYGGAALYREMAHTLVRMVTWPQARQPDQICWHGYVETGCGEANTASSTTNGREPPPTHLADVLGGFLVDSREWSGLKQLECSTKKLLLSKTKLGEDIPGRSSSESVPTSDELDHGALIADPTRFYGHTNHPVVGKD